MKVLYIGGWQRSGSTLIGNVLNEQEGFFHAGEICYLWTHKPWDRYRCGCGSVFAECPTWSSIFEEAFGSMAAMESYQPSRPGGLQLLPHLVRGTTLNRPGEAEYLSVLAALYSAIHTVTGCRVVVDSSKFPAHAYLLSRLDEVDLRILHLVRDPRGTAYSWRRVVHRADLVGSRSVRMPRFGLVNSTAKWLLWNVEIELLGRRLRRSNLRLRYESFVSDPIYWMRTILAFVDQPDSVSDVFSECTARVGMNHTVVGNPNRTRKGSIEIREDAEWKRQFPMALRIPVVGIAWPLMLRYGYLSDKDRCGSCRTSRT